MESGESRRSFFNSISERRLSVIVFSWYWAFPSIIALYIMSNLPRKTNRTYILYIAIAMIGFSFIAFMTLDRSAPSYLVVNTLMLGAYGVYDLFARNSSS